MRVAVTLFGSNVSPLFDTAGALRVVEIEDGELKRPRTELLGSLDRIQRVVRLVELGVQILLCGAISGFVHHALEARGIRVHSWVAGDVDEVMRTLATRLNDRDRTEPRDGLHPQRLVVSSTGPGLDHDVDPRFGRSPYLIVAQTDGRFIEAKPSFDGTRGGRWGTRAARVVVETGARVLLTGRCGPNALGCLSLAGIEVVEGVTGTVRDAVRDHGESRLPMTLTHEEKK